MNVYLIYENTLTNRREIMAYYLLQASEPKKRLTLQNWNGLVTTGLVPKELELQIRVFNFNKYVKNISKKYSNYYIDDAGLKFFENFIPDILDKIEFSNATDKFISKNIWDNKYQELMDPAREWIKQNQSELLMKYNDILFSELWNKYASGSISHWEMDSLCFYYGDHELKDIDNYKYGFEDFNELVSNDVDYFWKRGGVQIPIYKLTRIAGTVIAKDDNHHTVTLLTTTGVVPVKFSREFYSMFKKQVSQVQPDGTKKVIEKSWFKRGTILVVTGYRRDDQFVGKVYSSTQSHQIYKVTEIKGNELKLQHERVTPQGTIEEDYEE